LVSPRREIASRGLDKLPAGDDRHAIKRSITTGDSKVSGIGDGAGHDAVHDRPRAAEPNGTAADAALAENTGDIPKSGIRHHSWLLTGSANASFLLVLYRQVRLMLHYPWFWSAVPFVLLVAIFRALSAFTDGIGRSFDRTAHKRAGQVWQPARY